MKKQFTIIAILLVVVASAIIGLSYAFSFHNVTITLKSSDMTGSIYRYDANGTSSKVVPITSDQTIKLQAGDYGYVTDNAKYASTPAPFSVKKTDQTLAIDAAYSSQYLSTLLDSESAAISAVIAEKYAPILGQYDVDRGSLFGKGEWYGTKFTEHLDQGNNPGDVYHVVLHKVNDAWTIAAAPSIVLTTHDSPEVPATILTSVNNL